MRPRAAGSTATRRSWTSSVAVGEEEDVVVEFQLVHPQALLLVPLHLGHHGHHVPGDLLAEGGARLGAPAVAAHPVVAQGDIVLIAHGLGLMQEENKLQSEYQKLYASAMVEWEGQTLPS